MIKNKCKKSDCCECYSYLFSSFLYQKSMFVMRSCNTESHRDVAIKFIELSKKRFIKLFTLDYRCNSIDDMERMFDSLKFMR